MVIVGCAATANRLQTLTTFTWGFGSTFTWKNLYSPPQRFVPIRSNAVPLSRSPTARTQYGPPRVVSDLPAVRRVALEALQDMRSNNVRYAELRTTPRPLADGTSRRDCIENVLQVFQDFEINQAATPAPGVPRDSGGSAQESLDLGEGGGEPLPAGRLIPRLLLSVDRTKSTEEAMEVAKLALELQSKDEWRPFVLGMDFSGNPTQGSFNDFRSDQRTGSRDGWQSRTAYKNLLMLLHPRTCTRSLDPLNANTYREHRSRAGELGLSRRKRPLREGIQ